MSIVASQSLATQDFTCEMNPDLFPCNKTGKVRKNVTLSPKHLIEETGKLTSLQPSVKLLSLVDLRGGWFDNNYEDYDASIQFATPRVPRSLANKVRPLASEAVHLGTTILIL